MAPELQKRSSTLSIETSAVDSTYDDDGRLRRTGTVMTASAHIITAVIGSGVLSLSWAMAQLGWIAGSIALLGFSVITWFASNLLADSYRTHSTGTRNYNYKDVVKNNLGGMKYRFCATVQYANLIGITIGYVITASISMVAVKRSNCFHKNGHEAGCHTSNNMFMIIFGVIQLILSQIPNFHNLSILSIIAAIMSFGYAFIGFGLAFAKVVGGKSDGRTSLTGTIVGEDVTSTEKLWNTFQALGDIAFAYAFSTVLVEIQDTLKSSPPENQTMKKASTIGVAVTTIFYALCGILGYAAFGNNAPGNFLTGFGFYEPFWLVDIANLFIVIHLVGAFQVFCQPTFTLVEDFCSHRWPESKFIMREYPITIPLVGVFPLNMLRLIWRTIYVVVTSVAAMLFPFFNSVLALLGALSFWPLTVYFPVEMYIVRAKIQRFSFAWIWLQVLSGLCLVISLLAAAGSIHAIVENVTAFEPFHSVS